MRQLARVGHQRPDWQQPQGTLFEKLHDNAKQKIKVRSREQETDCALVPRWEVELWERMGGLPSDLTGQAHHQAEPPINREDLLDVITSTNITAAVHALYRKHGLICNQNPPGLERLKITLQPHQVYPFYWAKYMENFSPIRGGYIADEMGLGKTTVMISRIFDSDAPRERGHGLKGAHTLVVAPASTLNQWKKELEQQTNHGVGVVIWGDLAANVRKNACVALSITFKANIVLCGYEALVQAYTQHHGVKVGSSKKAKAAKPMPSALFLVKWCCVILDEAHSIANADSQRSQVCCQLDVIHCWCLSGTPS
ncbi:P-loop containing nucleoside triphosphate hydrolase protein [Calocera cornea HHB12733]|uniref:p-loop containing nucleoside triphosphate hydrolase protein n=1 Tax=Calocera cornea HHB12733 TaxID=1353952 RepID=A0A165F3H5_9BASI|nr:P-loop containing nucleoside triphosphate hydrolase protein [Calocera cornea HHB12733]